MGFRFCFSPALKPAAAIHTARAAAFRTMNPLIVIYGSTGAGKSDLAVELATRFNGEIINADAMQMYKGLPIITNKLRDEEQRGIPHHLLGSIGLDEDPWAVTHFRKEATRIISEIRARGKLPIVVGGTSYYLDGLLFEGRVVEDSPTAGGDGGGGGVASVREELAAKHPILNASAEAMLAKLREVDPVMADRWHPNDVRKIRTSLEIYLSTGRRASDIYAEQQRAKQSRRAAPDEDDDGGTAPSPPHPLGDLLLFWLHARRDVLNARLDQRVDKMVRSGLLSETAEVYDYLQRRLAAGETVDRSKGIWQSIGFRQFEPYLAALRRPDPPGPDAPALEKLRQAGIEDTKTATRQYAKYQLRWISMKTLPSLREAGLLDRFYVLDGTDVSRWAAQVLDKAVTLARQFLGGDLQAMPSPEALSDAAREVLSESAERGRRAAGTPCRKTCDVCGNNKVLLTEELWQAHLASRKHQKAVRARKRRSLIPVGDAPKRDLAVVEPQGSDEEGDETPKSIEAP
ncbi:hypothetical protein VTJ83DRAFT_3842 [Remersonia thermophila]|uniref:tRNA dimethylallyltransferase n=1 Tax=Remersonia thermophila TaxID=72144 RepID=A0ABR4DF82_9PEZI